LFRTVCRRPRAVSVPAGRRMGLFGRGPIRGTGRVERAVLSWLVVIWLPVVVYIPDAGRGMVVPEKSGECGVFYPFGCPTDVHVAWVFGVWGWPECAGREQDSRRPVDAY